MSTTRKCIAFLLALVFALSSVSFAALAEEEETIVEEAGSEEEDNTPIAEPDAENDPEAVPPAAEEAAEKEKEESAAAAAEPAGEYVPETVEEPAVVNTTCNLRRDRSMSMHGNIIRNMKKGDKVTVTAFYSDGWCEVKYGSKIGFLQTSWLNFPGKTIDDIPAAAAAGARASVNDDPGLVVLDTEGRGQFKSPVATENPVVPEVKFKADRAAEVIPTGIAVGESSTNEVLYIASTRKKRSIKQEPNTTSRILAEVKKGKRLQVMAYGDEWCKVATYNGQTVGYMKQENVFHYHALDPFKSEIPWYNSYKPTGYIYATKPFHITDRKDLYKGQQVQTGDLICVQLRDDGDYNLLLRRDWITIPKEYGEYHAFAKWDEAKAGDIIGGFTLYYGIGEGGYWAKNRAFNIGRALQHMDKVIVGSGKKYSFLTNVNATRKNGYKTAGIIGGNGRGTGGGICHTSSLTYIALLSIPAYIYEREPHTDAGVFYIPLEFDATVGGWSDMIYYNILPYDIEHHSYHNAYNGTMTLVFECLETKSEDELKNWDWQKSLSIPKAKDEGGQ